MEVTTKNAQETKDLGKKLSVDLETNIFALSGDLGSGKTTFVQGFASALGVKDIISPTFILMRTYDIAHEKYKSLYHLDLYRLETQVEQSLKDLGIEEVWEDPRNIVLIEWAEKARELIPKDAAWIYFENISEKAHKIRIE